MDTRTKGTTVTIPLNTPGTWHLAGGGNTQRYCHQQPARQLSSRPPSYWRHICNLHPDYHPWLVIFIFIG